ncbi:MAG: UbiA prenyltransferase family protein [archaeon]
MAKKKTSTKAKASSAKASLQKKWNLFEKLLGFAELGRPVEWSKTLLNMTLAMLIVVYTYSGFINPLIFIEGFFSVALLWSGLYALNDWTDWKIDSVHEVKKNRPIPSGKVTPNQGIIFSIALILISFLIAFYLSSPALVVCLLAMVANQLLYTTKPFRLKSRKYFDVISGSMINPFFRYFSGIVLFVPLSALFSIFPPVLPILFVVGIQFSGYSLYRLFSKKHDEKVKMKSSVALMSEQKVKLFSYGAMCIAGLSYIGLLINGATLQVFWLGFIPLQFVWAIVIVFLQFILTPSLINAVLHPGKADMKSSYRMTYFLTIMFIVANLLILFLFP